MLMHDSVLPIVELSPENWYLLTTRSAAVWALRKGAHPDKTQTTLTI